MAQNTGMLSRDQLLYLFDRFAHLTSLPDVKNRIADAVQDNQEAVAVTTAIQEEIFLEMGVDPSFGIGCLGKVNLVYENDRDLMIRFYGFVAKEEMACDEAELGTDEFVRKMHSHNDLQAQQLEMLKFMRKFHMDDQSAILEKGHRVESKKTILERVLGVRSKGTGPNDPMEVLMMWSQLPESEATWEDYTIMKNQFPSTLRAKCISRRCMSKCRMLIFPVGLLSCLRNK